MDADFVTWVGKLSYDPLLEGLISLPSYIKQTTDFDSFINDIYPKEVLENPLENSMFFKEKAILCCKNDSVDAINSKY